jgi:uncharacterized protein
VIDYVPITKQTPLPDPGQARAWWDDYAMLDNIRDHSEMVCFVALAITDWLALAGVKLHRRAVEVGALVHDISKTPCIGTTKLHAQEGGALITSLGYPELGYMVANHVYLNDDHPLDETMVVNYADKRVTHDQIVDLDSRFAYIADRYGLGDPDPPGPHPNRPEKRAPGRGDDLQPSRAGPQSRRHQPARKAVTIHACPNHPTPPHRGSAAGRRLQRARGVLPLGPRRGKCPQSATLSCKSI